MNCCPDKRVKHIYLFSVISAIVLVVVVVVVLRPRPLLGWLVPANLSAVAFQ
jgi:hypothetical protein